MTRPEKEMEIGSQLDRIFNDINAAPHIHGQMVRVASGLMGMVAHVAIGLYEVADAIKELRRG